MGQQVAALSQAAAIAGLGGIGKTQMAIEYAYHYHFKQKVKVYEWVFWVRADTELNVVTGLAEIARSLELGEGKLEELANLALRWLATNPGWLLIFDNADDPELLEDWLPKLHQGRVLLTSRASQFDSLGIDTPIELKKLSQDDSIWFLFQRVKRPIPASSVTQKTDDPEFTAADMLAKELDGLPLALEQAAAYIKRIGKSFTEYWNHYQKRRLELLERGKPKTGKYPETVATAWLLNFEEVAENSPESVLILQLSSVLAADDIAEWMLLEGAEAFGLTDCTDELALAEQLAALADFSLITREQNTASYSIHRMVQEVVWQGLTAAEQQDWLQRAISGLNAVFPYIEFENWSVCGQLVPHVQEIAARQTSEPLETTEWVLLLNQAGVYLHSQGRYGEAEPLHQRALRISEAQLGADHPSTATSLNNLAVLYDSMGRYGEAEPLHQRALRISEAQLGADYPSTATSLNNLAALYRSMGRYEEAEPLYQRALQIKEAQLGADHPSTAISLNNLAALYDSMGRYGEAEPLYQRALQIKEAQLGADHPSTATSLDNLAVLYGSMGWYGEAEPLYQRALQIREAQLGPEHPETAQSLNNLAVFYDSMGRYGEAELLYLRTLVIWMNSLGEDHPNTQTTWSNYRYLLQQALTAGKAHELSDHPTTQEILEELKAQSESGN